MFSLLEGQSRALKRAFFVDRNARDKSRAYLRSKNKIQNLSEIVRVSLTQFLDKFLDLLAAETIRAMVVDDARCLHPCIDDDRPDKFEATLLERF